MEVSDPKPMLEVGGLVKHFPIRSGVFSRVVGHVKAVDGVSFSVHDGETYALVGESGCGKSTTGQTVLRLLEPTDGKIRFRGTDVVAASGSSLRKLRREMQIIFQDPYSALNPRMTVETAIAEPLVVHGLADSRGARRKAREVLERCGLPPYYAKRYPHEFSGGQRQRIVIARALIMEPSFIVADEPVSALDVSIQSQIINLLKDLQADYGLTFLFISHDLAVVRHMADRIGVMYLGNLVEEAPKADFYAEPLHPYSKALISAIPRAHPAEKKERIVLSGDVPSPADPPAGCPFHTRCPFAMDVCKTVKPKLLPTETGRRVACHLVHPPEKSIETAQPEGEKLYR
jgi:oligopeptide/dipeptide ABC transporter ATP-binding protein